MTKGEIDSAVRRALNLLDKWLDVTGVVDKHTGYYYELQGVVEDAVHCGAQQALGIYDPLPTEVTGEQLPCSYQGADKPDVKQTL